MTARVNLLPREIEQRARARRTSSWAIGAVAAYAALLGLLYIAKLSDLQSAREDRDAAAEQVASLQQELATLQEFAELDRQLAARNALLRDAMEREISWARVFNDLSLTFPPSSSLIGLTAAAEATDTTATVEGTDAPTNTIGNLSFNGYSVERYAPGVERVLVKFDEVTTFFNSYLATAGEEQRGDTEVTAFTGTVQLNAEAYTGRYADGLPPEVGR
jgi:Tfp pilus assembly protein PilN